MKKNRLLTLASALALVVGGTSCSDYYGYAPSTKRGAVAGGLVGAGIGTIVGSQSDRPLEGAAIGGAIGALGGAVLGSARDDERYGYADSSYHRPTHSNSGYYQSSSHYYSPRPYYGYSHSYHRPHYNRGYHHRSYGGYHGGYSRGGCRY